MLSLFSSRAARWEVSAFSDLPSVVGLPGQQLRDYGLLAGGLALVLSRCSPNAIRRDFKAASEAYKSLRRQIGRQGKVQLPRQLLNDASHEIAQYADPATREALRRCMSASHQ